MHRLARACRNAVAAKENVRTDACYAANDPGPRPKEEAIKAVTINAAEFLGLSDRLGSLEPGKQATFLITTGTPIDMTSNILQAYIQGRELDMNDIQKHFFNKYMEKIKQMMKIIS